MGLANTVGATQQANLIALAAIVDAVAAVRHDATRFSGIVAATFANLRALLALHAPGSAFAGFTQWGPGDHGDSALNLKYHFLKHVCFSASEHDEPTESAWWWGVLNINLTSAQMNNFFARTTSQKDKDALLRLFDAHGVIPAKRAEFLKLGGVGLHPDCISYMIATYQNTYRDYAINQSAQLASKLVQSNGEKVFISGGVANVGNPQRGLFIIGRLDGAGQLGISSCYACLDLQTKLNGAASNKVWDLQ
ncbi:MAG: hypothetical protein WBE76_10010 [Terracidiphilus sp.]